MSLTPPDPRDAMHAPLDVSGLPDAQIPPVPPAPNPVPPPADAVPLAPTDADFAANEQADVATAESAIGPTRDFDVAGNRIRLFVDTHSYVWSLIDDIRKATKRVWIESYIFVADELG